MQKIGFSLQNSYNAPIPEVLRLLREIGFCAVSPTWQRDANLEDIVSTARRCGLILQSLHGPFQGITGMWDRDASCAAPILQDLLQAADDCAAYGIPVMVVHVWGGYSYTFRESALFF